MRVFVDVGAHYGEALEIALDPEWAFDRILLLEPAAACQSLLRKFRDRRIEAFPIAIGSANGTATLYGAGQLGASLFRGKKQKAKSDELKSETITLVRASEWFRAHVPEFANVYMKFNCEGAECDIIEDLLDAGLARQMTSLYVDFDIRKVEGQAHRQQHVENRLRENGVRYSTPEELRLNGAKGVAKWLALDCHRSRASTRERLRHRLRLYAPPYVRFKSIAATILPRTIYFWLGRRFGRLTRDAAGKAHRL
jgi:FkbM family methyltransferase